MTATLEAEVAAVARQLAGTPSSPRGAGRWSDRLLTWAMADPHFKTQLFRFTDVFPAMSGSEDVARHLDEYFDDVRRPRTLALATKVARVAPAPVVAWVARRAISTMAKQFIVGANPRAALPRLRELWDAGRSATVDLLGEKVVTAIEADRYAARLAELVTTLVDSTPAWPARPQLEHDDIGPLPRANVSIKPTALAPHLSPLTADVGLAEARQRLLPILQLAASRGCFVWFDMEHYDVKDLTHELFRSLLAEPSLADLDAGIVVQAYLRDSHEDLLRVLSWAPERARPVGIRLVKGAYWDAERIHARAEHWPVPVYEDKDATDANFERCTDELHAAHGAVRAAFGSHNLRSLAYAIARARSLRIPDDGYELQMLYGMADSVQAAIARRGFRLRVYAPVGELVPGMAYLVRRLLENTSNESFVRQRFVEHRQLDELLSRPRPTELPGSTESVPPGITRTRAAEPSPYEPEPPTEWRHSEARERFAAVVARTEASLARDVPAVIGDHTFMTARTIRSVDPACPTTVVATSACCSVDDADAAIAAARGVEDTWRRTPATARADVLFGAAAWMRERRDELAALEVFEAGKPWAEADGDVCEAIDFCEYYGREALRLDRGGVVQSPPGERNVLRYRGKGVGVVIAPWNFPLAIPVGMTVAGLAAGNPVILKPAEQTPAIIGSLVEALRSSGLPDGVLGFLPGIGEETGAHLVSHKDVSWVCFTGSMAVGLAIVREAAKQQPGQRHVKRVIAEMGGKNALIVDSDADLDQAVPTIITSAFSFSGQKCSAASRLVVLEAVYDELMERLSGAVRELVLDHPKHSHAQVGPVIDADAHAMILGYLDLAAQEGEVVVRHEGGPETGWFVPPTVVAVRDRSARVATEEIFGPLLTVSRARDFDEAVEIANATDYALTAGVLSRSPVNIARAGDELRAGNIYINRPITGAVVGRQPFGGYGLSGVGSKAGGPDYLLQFSDPWVVTENTLRQGFAPEDP